ncbi:MAG: cysteine synthase A [Sorangiineae bacterium]|nr:cysteine synthase A [Polyangiaceae bacterium]MEB2322759.1 cysteine synthase A [Sorangiineae bacterium]
MSYRKDLSEAIGHTPLIRLRRVSDATGCELLGKAEFMNPGGSIKDRTALGLLNDAEAKGLVRPGTILVEGTAGNTGIGLALLGASRGHRSIIVMPSSQSPEKIDALRLTGAEVRLVPPAKAADPNHYVNRARALAEELNQKEPGSAWFADQFDNLANRAIHEALTGPELWDDLGGRIDGFVCSAGTGGSLAGISRALKARDSKVVTALADPDGSALASYVNHGALEAHGSSFTEGIGVSRVTANFDGAPLDRAWSIADTESVPLLHELLFFEGLCLGGSSGVNVAGAVRLARELGPGHTIVTLLCDSGTRYKNKLFSPAFLREKGVPVPAWLDRAVPG